MWCVLMHTFSTKWQLIFSVKKYFPSHYFVMFLRLLQSSNSLRSLSTICVSSYTPPLSSLSIFKECNQIGHRTQREPSTIIKWTQSSKRLFMPCCYIHSQYVTQPSFFSQQVEIDRDPQPVNVQRIKDFGVLSPKQDIYILPLP